MDRPTAAEIRSWTPLFGYEEYGYPAPSDPAEDPLNRVIALFVEWLEAAIGYDIDDDAYPENQQERTKEAIKMGVLYKVVSGDQGIIETAADFDLIESFAAGSYNETRRAGGFNSRALHPWPALNSLIVDLLSPEKRSMGVPEIRSVAPDWNVGREIIDAKKIAGQNYRGPTPLWVTLPLP